MARVVIKLPVGIAKAGGSSTLECEGATVGQVLADAALREPRLRPRVFRDDGSIWVGVFLNGRNIRQAGGLEAPVSDGDEIRVLPPIAGG